MKKLLRNTKINTKVHIIQKRFTKSCCMQRDIHDMKKIADVYGVKLIHTKCQLGSSDSSDIWWDEFLLIGDKSKNYLIKKCCEDISLFI